MNCGIDENPPLVGGPGGPGCQTPPSLDEATQRANRAQTDLTTANTRLATARQNYLDVDTQRRTAQAAYDQAAAKMPDIHIFN